MKKLVALMMILAVATMASATVTEYSLSTDGDVLFVTGLAGATVSGDYLLSEGSIIDITVPSVAVLNTVAGNGGSNEYVAGDLAAVSIAAVGGAFGDIAQIYSGVLAAGDSVDAGLWFTIDLDDFDVSSFSAGQIIGSVSVLDVTATSRGSLDLTFVPEPITVALLGLGGLFIRRKK